MLGDCQGTLMVELHSHWAHQAWLFKQEESRKHFASPEDPLPLISDHKGLVVVPCCLGSGPVLPSSPIYLKAKSLSHDKIAPLGFSSLFQDNFIYMEYIFQCYKQIFIAVERDS